MTRPKWVEQGHTLDGTPQSTVTKMTCITIIYTSDLPDRIVMLPRTEKLLILESTVEPGAPTLHHDAHESASLFLFPLFPDLALSAGSGFGAGSFVYMMQSSRV